MEPFLSPVTYEARESSSFIQFFPESDGQRFVWRGPGADKAGTYQFLEREGAYFLELSYNYAREDTYQFTILHAEDETITRFIIKDSQGRETEFRKT
jgi:hypothetical protein